MTFKNRPCVSLKAYRKRAYGSMCVYTYTKNTHTCRKRRNERVGGMEAREGGREEGRKRERERERERERNHVKEDLP